LLAFEGIDNPTFAYFCHLFCRAKDKVAIADDHGYGIDFTSSICKDNIYGVQFHPEKSQEVGLKIVQNFVERA